MIIKRRSRPYYALEVCLRVAPIETICSFFIALINGLVPLLMLTLNSNFINTTLSYISGRSVFNDLLISVGILIICFLILYVSSVISQLLNARIRIGLRTKYHVAIIERCTALRYEHIENHETCNLINRIVNTPGYSAIEQTFMQFLSLTNLLINIVSISIVIYTINWWLLPFYLVMSVPMAIISYYQGKDFYNVISWNSELSRKSGYLEMDVLRGRDLAAERIMFGFSKFFNKKFIHYFMGAVHMEMKIRKKWILIHTIVLTLLVGITALMAIFFYRSLEAGLITIGFFISIVLAVFQLQDSIICMVPQVTAGLSQGYQYCKDLTDFMNLSLEETVQADESSEQLAEIKTIEFQNVYFHYPNTEQWVLNGVSFRMEAGKHYSFVGKNGSGKSTITKLLLGLYDADKGTILINGIDIKTIQRDKLYSLFSVVYQDFSRYAISIEDNIGIGDINCYSNDTLIRNIAQTTGITDFVMKLSQGFKTPLGKIIPGGVDISGGQWQKIALTRALMNPRSFKIFDEPTAALDPLEESRLYMQYNDILEKQTSLFISHRLGSTKLADTIFVIDGGTIVEEGSHDMLMTHDGLYRKMFSLQKEWYDESKI